MKNGATIYLESSWALNTTDIREAATTLCGTEAGAEIISGIGKEPALIINTSKYGKLFEERPSTGNSVAFFEAENDGDPGYLEAKQWLKSIIEDTQPLVVPQEAFIVTKILDAIYKSAETGKMIEF